MGTQCDPQPLGSFGHCWVVDRLNINTVVCEQHVRDQFAFVGFSDDHGDDVAVIVQMRNTHRIEPGAQRAHCAPLPCPFGIAVLKVFDGSAGTSGNCGRYCGGEDKARGK